MAITCAFAIGFDQTFQGRQLRPVAAAGGTLDRFEAAFMCKRFIKKAARDPDSIEFISAPWSATHMPGNIYSARITYRGTNGFGGKTVSTLDCRLAPGAGMSGWSLVALDELNS